MTDRVSMIIVTYRRPDSVRECMQHLSKQLEPADQVIVVDASEDRSTADVVADFGGVMYVHNPAGAGNITSSRNAGVKVANGDILGFLDDDAYAEPGYVQNLRRAYADPTVALACARTLNGQLDEAALALEGVGRLLDDGQLIGNFASDLGPGKVVDIDHGIGATMSFRRSTLHAMGGFRDDYSGTGLREETDAFLRARRLGLRAVFVNDAVAHHVPASHATGQRFDLRYEYWGARNHALLLINNFGMSDRRLLRSVVGHVAATLTDSSRTLLRRSARALVGISGFLGGIGIALHRQRGRPLPARLEGAAADDLRVRLGQT